jgi:hypothetical protein
VSNKVIKYIGFAIMCVFALGLTILRFGPWIGLHIIALIWVYAIDRNNFLPACIIVAITVTVLTALAIQFFIALLKDDPNIV